MQSKVSPPRNDIFGGMPAQKAELKFSIHASRWVENEEWHPAQVSKHDADGHYVVAPPVNVLLRTSRRATQTRKATITTRAES